MDIHRSTLLAALGRLITGPLAHTNHYGYLQLSAAWRETGLRQDDLRQALRYCVAEDYLELHGDEVEARYRLTEIGSHSLGGASWSPWARWRDGRCLEQLRLRSRLPAVAAATSRRSSDAGIAPSS